jgi:hypothetical protein
LKMKILNLLVVCFIVGDALASRMALASKRGTMSNLMPLLKNCLTLLRARLPCLRITRVTEREMCHWAISKYFGDLVSNTSA